LSVYYLPRLSEIHDRKELRNEILKGYKTILPIVGFIALLIWLLKDVVIHLLFTPDFLPMKSLFTFQLLGDFFKIGSWLLAFLMLAKAMTRIYIITEIFFGISFVALSFFFMNRYGMIGTTYSFCINYGAYWITMFLLMKNKISN
jgi:PST family polysaccharide transporter